VLPALYLLLRAAGWLNTYLAVILPDCALWTPLATWVLAGAFGRIPADVCAQAETDGCTALQVMRRVALPLAAPAVCAAALLVFIGAWGEYLFALTFLFQPEMMPLSVALQGVSIGHGIDSAAAVLVTIPLSGLVALAQPSLIRGLQAVAVR
jgi:multiple sugar transport system permease protein